jgi:RNA polymerase sigma-70 factor, ECF subfamily
VVVRPLPTQDPETAHGATAIVHHLPFAGDDAALVEGLRAGRTAARAALFDRYARHVQRILARVLGGDPELEDLLHEVFVRALAGIDGLTEPARLESWLTSISVFTARGVIRKRRARRWLRFLAPEDLPEREAPGPSAEVTRALRQTYRLLDRLPTDERIAFTLRVIEGMDMADVATACRVSVATIKRRIKKGEARFRSLAATEPALAGWIESGSP